MTSRWSWAAALVLAFIAPLVAAAPTTIRSVRVSAEAETTRVVFDLSAPAEHRVFSLADPDRVVIDLANTAPAQLKLDERRGLVKGLRTGMREGGTLRVVLELTASAKPKSFLLAPNGEQGHRLVVDLTGAQDAETVVRRTTLPAPTQGRDVVIAIDAGHGGQDPGASGRAGSREKDVVLAIAKRLAREIDEQPGMRAVLTRDGDYFVSLRKRMEIAHAARADFFVSIHADAHRDSAAKGATVYVLSEKGASDEAALLLAQRENAADLLGGVSLSDKDQVLARVLLDLSQNAALSASIAAGQRVINRMGAVTLMRKTQVQQAPFLVLKSPDIPSLLVETAYISNPREEQALRSASHQATLARAIREGIVDYFTANPPPGTYFAMRDARQDGEPLKHVIARGETLSGIAQRYNVSVASLRRANSLGNSDQIRIGQVLSIPRG